MELVRARDAASADKDVYPVIAEFDNHYLVIGMKEAASPKVGYASLALLYKDYYDVCGAIDNVALESTTKIGGSE